MSVSCETAEKEEFFRLIEATSEQRQALETYAALLTKWQSRINLVGPSTLPHLWTRHFLDSAQLVAHLPPEGPVLDLGSGAGFPGLIIAILHGGPVHLVESDIRKGTFLREVIRQTGAPASVHSVRIEALKPFPVCAVTARALAPVAKLLEWAEPFLPGAQCLFLKGRTCEEELAAVAGLWTMRAGKIPSVTDPSGIILRLEEVHRG